MHVKDFNRFVNEQGKVDLDADAIIFNDDSAVAQLRIDGPDGYKAKFGNDWNGFGGIEYTQDSKIKKVTNYFDGESTVSKRNEVKDVAQPNEFHLNPTFTYKLNAGETKKVAFIYSRDGKKICKSKDFEIKGLNAPTMSIIHLVTSIYTPGKYVLTNTLDKNYWLEIEVQ